MSDVILERKALTYLTVKKYNGTLSFATDAWTSPNHRTYVAITVHLEHDGIPLCLLLDLVEVVASHNSINLANTFAGVLQEFGIEHKVSDGTSQSIHAAHQNECNVPDPEYHIEQCLQ